MSEIQIVSMSQRRWRQHVSTFVVAFLGLSAITLRAPEWFHRDDVAFVRCLHTSSMRQRHHTLLPMWEHATQVLQLKLFECLAGNLQSSLDPRWLQTPPVWKCCWSGGKCHGRIFHNPYWLERQRERKILVCFLRVGWVGCATFFTATYQKTGSPSIKAWGASF